MQRVYRSTKTASLPAPPAQSVTPGYFTAGDPGLGIPATVPGYEWFNGMQEEVAYVIEQNGLTLSRLDNTLLYQAITAQINSRIASVDAFKYKGVIDCSSNPNYPAADAGDTYKISVAGKIGGGSGPNVEVGDMIICTTDSTSSGTHGSVGANWNIIQGNIDGAVTGPASSTSANITTFSGTSGKVIQDSGKAFSTDGTLAGNSDALIPTQKAVKTYVDSTAAKLAGDRVGGTRSETASMTTSAATIPHDDSLPQDSEGAQLLTASYTPANSSNIIRVRIGINFADSATADMWTFAVFTGASANALFAVVDDSGSVHEFVSVMYEFEFVAGTTSAISFQLRHGGQGATITFNGQNGGRMFGGSLRCFMTIEEFKV